jgi:hypothetical protein
MSGVAGGKEDADAGRSCRPNKLFTSQETRRYACSGHPTRPRGIALGSLSRQQFRAVLHLLALDDSLTFLVMSAAGRRGALEPTRGSGARSFRFQAAIGR